MASELFDLKLVKESDKLYDDSNEDAEIILWSNLAYKPITNYYDKQLQQSVSGVAPLPSNILVALALTEISCAEGRGKHNPSLPSAPGTPGEIRVRTSLGPNRLIFLVRQVFWCPNQVIRVEDTVPQDPEHPTPHRFDMPQLLYIPFRWGKRDQQRWGEMPHMHRLALLNAHNGGLSMGDCVMPIVLLAGIINQSLVQHGCQVQLILNRKMYLGWRPEPNSESMAEVMTAKLVVQRLVEMFGEKKTGNLALYEDVLQADNELRQKRGRRPSRAQNTASQR